MKTSFGVYYDGNAPMHNAKLFIYNINTYLHLNLNYFFIHIYNNNNILTYYFLF